MERDQERKKDVSKLRGRNNLDYIYQETKNPVKDIQRSITAIRSDRQINPAEKRLQIINNLKRSPRRGPGLLSPVNPASANWVEVGPLAITHGQTYGGARVLVTGRVTAISPHPSNGNIIYLGSSRGGIWKTADGATTWNPISDHAESLAIGALDVSQNNPQILYAGTGEGNLQLYSTVYALNSAPGIYLGIGVLKSMDAGSSWVLQGSAVFANKSFYRLVIHPTDPDKVFAATSAGLARCLNGTTWSLISGGGLPAISTTVIACTDVLFDATDSTGNTVFAAFWADGIYKTTNALAPSPSWTKITSGLPSGGTISRISLAQSPSSPATKFALFASSGDSFQSIRMTTNAAGTSWTQIIGSGISLYGAFTSHIAVDPTTPNTLYVSGVELYKCTFNGVSWNVNNIGSNIHPDSHAFAFHPTNNLIIYSGNDGGIFKSSNGGTTWDDSINKGLNLLQYEAIDDYPTSDAIVLGGTQDNGSNSFRNNPVFYHADDGDGGYCAIDGLDGKKQISSYYGSSFKRSGNGGEFGSWSSIASGITGNGLFYPPLAKSPSTSRVCVGTDRLNVNDTPHGVSAWSAITLPSIVGRVSAVSFASDTIIYAATTSGQVYRATKSGATWTTQKLDASPLPGGWIWDIQAFPGNINQVLIVYANFGITQHVWTGTVPTTGSATWVASSGSGTGALPDLPFYAIAFESPSAIYVGSDIGVFKTNDAGTSWSYYNSGMPNTAIYDLRFYGPQNLLRAATHGRGLWEIKTDLIPTPPSDLYFRDHAMHTGRLASSGTVKAGFADALQHINLNDNLHWWQSVDIKIDAPTSIFGGYQFPVAQVDYVVYETALEHKNPDKGNVNRVYVRVQNRGTGVATNVQVKVMYTGASAGLPDLPADFWTQFPSDSALASPWNPVGAAQTIATLPPGKPVILEWNWNPPTSADTHSCMLVVMDSAADPIPAANKVFQIAQLITTEKRAALKNLHLVDVVPGLTTFLPFHFNALSEGINYLNIDYRRRSSLFELGLIFPEDFVKHIIEEKSYRGYTIKKLNKREIDQLRKQWIDQEYKDRDKVERYIEALDFRYLFIARSRKPQIKVDLLKKVSEVNALLLATSKRASRSFSQFSIIQQTARKSIEGGSTFILKNPTRFG